MGRNSLRQVILSNPLDPRRAACEKATVTWGTAVKLPKMPTSKKATAKPLVAAASPKITTSPKIATSPKITPSPKILAAKALTEGQRTYEAKRAAKAGMSLDKWLASKQRQQEAEEKAKLKAAEAAKPPKPPGFFARLLERAHRPLGS
jgi:hypothetical protein